jgi:hypothetical protein
MSLPVNLTLGDHDITRPAVGWTVNIVDANVLTVELIASLQSHPTAPAVPSRGQTATSVAIRTDLQAAMSLYEQLGELGRNMGWLPQE